MYDRKVVVPPCEKCFVDGDWSIELNPSLTHLCLEELEKESIKYYVSTKLFVLPSTNLREFYVHFAYESDMSDFYDAVKEDKLQCLTSLKIQARLPSEMECLCLYKRPSFYTFNILLRLMRFK